MKQRIRQIKPKLYLLFFFTLAICGLNNVADALTITIIYDNSAYKEGLSPDYGFSCLIEETEKTILFDTGKKGNLLFENFGKLNVNPERIDYVVISHNHEDHTGGLLPFLAVNNKVTAFLADPSLEMIQEITARKKKFIRTELPINICKGVFVTGAMGEAIKEQALVINTSLGLIVIVGCSHPGIINMLRKIQTLFRRPVHLVIGGFHTMPKSEKEMRDVIKQFKLLGVRNIGPGHCTEERAKEYFKAAYGENYIHIGVGKVLSFSAR